MTISLPDLTVGDVVDGSSSTYSYGNFFKDGHEMLADDLSKGDVEIKTTATGVGDPTGTFGIDADTIVYYYNGKDGSVAVGYDNMAKLIDKDGKTGSKIDGVNVKVSIVDLYKSDVANVIVLYTDQAKFGDDNYVFVMSEFDVYNDYYYYTVIHEDGSMEEVKSEDNLRADLKGTDGLVYTMDVNSKGIASFGDAANVVEGYVKVTSSRYVNVYQNVNDAIQNKGKDDEWLDMSKLTNPKRLANKNDDLIYDVENTDIDDTSATNTTFEDGQYGFVVYDEDAVVKAAFIVKSYLTEDPTGSNKPGIKGDYEFDTLEASRGDDGKIDFVIDDSEIGGWKLGSSEITYTISKDNGASRTYTQRLSGDIAFSALANQMNIPGYTINAGSTGEYEIEVVVEFNGTTGNAVNNTYTISGTTSFVID